MESPSLNEALAAYRNQRDFNPEKFVSEICAELENYLRINNLSGTVVSVSGGVDSAVTYALCKKCQELYPDTLKKVVAIGQPIHSSAWATERGNELCEKFGDKLFIVDQTTIFDQLTALVSNSLDLARSSFADGQMKSYMRTPVGYYAAQLLSSNGIRSVVMGTGNKDEDGYLAYFCKAGDGVVDLQLIAGLHKSEVFTVGSNLGVPESILSAKPSADLWDGQTDEDEIGVSYDFIELFAGWYLKLSEIDQKKFINGLKDGFHEFSTSASRVMKIHKANSHKLNSPKNLYASYH